VIAIQIVAVVSSGDAVAAKQLFGAFVDSAHCFVISR
jgi:hypothetical protein